MKWEVTLDLFYEIMKQNEYHWLDIFSYCSKPQWMVITLINMPMSVLCLLLPTLSWSSVVVDKIQIPKLEYSLLSGGEMTANSSALNVRILWWHTVTHSKLTNNCGRNYADILFHLSDPMTSKKAEWFNSQKRDALQLKAPGFYCQFCHWLTWQVSQYDCP